MIHIYTPTQTNIIQYQFQLPYSSYVHEGVVLLFDKRYPEKTETYGRDKMELIKFEGSQI